MTSNVHLLATIAPFANEFYQMHRGPVFMMKAIPWVMIAFMYLQAAFCCYFTWCHSTSKMQLAQNIAAICIFGLGGLLLPNLAHNCTELHGNLWWGIGQPVVLSMIVWGVWLFQQRIIKAESASVPA